MPGERTARSIGLQPRQSNAMLTFSCTITLRKNFFPVVALQILLMFVNLTYRHDCCDSQMEKRKDNSRRHDCCSLFALCANRLQQPCRWRRGKADWVSKQREPSRFSQRQMMSGTNEVKLTRDQKDLHAKTLVVLCCCSCLLSSCLFLRIYCFRLKK